MRKGKAPVIEEKVVWTTGSDGNANYCIGFFTDDATSSFIVKEAKNAPVDRETLKSRASLAKQRRDTVSDPMNPGYSEQYVLLMTSSELDDDDFKKIGLPRLSIPDNDDIYKGIDVKISVADASAINLNTKKHYAYKLSVSPAKIEE